MNKRTNIKLDAYISECMNTLEDVLHKPFSYYFQKYKNKYKQIILKEFENIEFLKNNKSMQEKISKYIVSNKFNDDASISFLTSIYVKNLFIENERMDSVDYTSISVGLYKTVEIVLNQIINDNWCELKVMDKKDKIILANNKKMELGSMQLIYNNGIMPLLLKEYTSENDIQNINQISDDIQTWRNDYRNGFCHKEAQVDKNFCEKLEIFAKEFIIKIIQYLEK